MPPIPSKDILWDILSEQSTQVPRAIREIRSGRTDRAGVPGFMGWHTGIHRSRANIAISGSLHQTVKAEVDL